MTRRVALFHAVLIFASAAFVAGVRADVPLELRGQRVVEVEIAGEASSATSSREIGIPIGAPVTRLLVRSAVQRLVRSGRWSDVQIDLVPIDGGVRVVAHLVPRIVLARIEVQENDVLSDDEILRALDVAAGREIEPEALATLSEAAKQAYAERGYERAEIELVLRDTDDPGRKVLIVRAIEGEPTRVAALRFVGEAPPPESGAIDAIDLELGDVFDRSTIDEAIARGEERLRERGWLEARLGPVEVRRGRRGAAIDVPIVVGPRYDVVIRGAEPLERSDVDGVLQAGAERLEGSASIEGMRARVLDLYQRHGFHDARVSIARVAGARRGTASLVVTVVPGPQLEVLAVSFPGAIHFDVEFLRSQIFSYLEEDLPGATVFEPVDTHTVERIGLGGSQAERTRRTRPPHVVEPSRIYFPATYEEAIEHVRELYQAEGFLAARVGPAELRRMGTGRAIVVVPVVEGPRSMLHGVELSGNEILSAREILEAAELSRGMPFSHLALEQARVRILDLYREAGHLYARVEPEVRFSGDRTRAEVRFTIVERFSVHVGQLVVRGANRTSETLIRDRLTFGPGDLYRPSEARKSQERLEELGVFSAVSIAPQDQDLPARVKTVVVTVTERPTQFLDFSLGLSTGEGVRGGFEYGYRNLFGFAIRPSLRVQLAYQFFFLDETLERRFTTRLTPGERLEYNVALGVAIPHIPALDRLQTSIDAVLARDYERDFGITKNGAVLTTSLKVSKRLNFTLSPQLENNFVRLLVDEGYEEYLRNTTDPRLQRLLRVPEGETTLVALYGSMSLDLRDNPFTPTRGVYVSAVSEWARTLRSEEVDVADVSEQFFSNHIKVALTTSGYAPLTDSIVLAGQLRLGRVFHLTDSSRTYPNRRFFLGGVDTIRGYFQDALIPQDLADEIEADPALGPNDVLRGGDLFILLRGELRFLITGALHGGVFTDVGNLWASVDSFEPEDVVDLRPTAGVGIRIATPVGPIAVDYGVNLLRRRALNEPFGALHFSIGLF